MQKTWQMETQFHLPRVADMLLSRNNSATGDKPTSRVRTANNLPNRNLPLSTVLASNPASPSCSKIYTDVRGLVTPPLTTTLHDHQTPLMMTLACTMTSHAVTPHQTTPHQSTTAPSLGQRDRPGQQPLGRRRGRGRGHGADCHGSGRSRRATARRLPALLLLQQHPVGHVCVIGSPRAVGMGSEVLTGRQHAAEAGALAGSRAGARGGAGRKSHRAARARGRVHRAVRYGP